MVSNLFCDGVTVTAKNCPKNLKESDIKNLGALSLTIMNVSKNNIYFKNGQTKETKTKKI